MRKSILAFLLLSVFAGAALAGAQIGPRAGYYSVSDADEGTWLFGGAIRLKPIPFFGVEGSVDYRKETYYDNALTVKSWPVQVTALVYPLPIVYGLAGAGWYYTTFEYDALIFTDLGGSDTTNEFGYHFGGGVEVPLGPGLSVAGDIRYVFLNYDFQDLPGTEQADSDFYAITIALLLGGR